MIAECVVKDRIWGIGLSMKDEDRFCMDRWKGQNLLGKILMRVRKKLNIGKKCFRIFHMEVNMALILQVPYEEKDEAKALGAK